MSPAPFTPLAPSPAAADLSGFNASTRMRDDTADLSQQAILNMQYSQNTLTTPYRAGAAPVVRGINASRGAFGYSAQTTVLDSGLTWSAAASMRPVGTQLKAGINKRIFLTVPYMGRGSVNVAVDDALRRGEAIHNAAEANANSMAYLREPAKRNGGGAIDDRYNNPANVPLPGGIVRAQEPIHARGGDSSR